MILTAHPSRFPVTVLAAWFVAACICLGNGTAEAQGQVRAWAMGDAMTASARGLAAITYNPANLALSSGSSLGLASVAVRAGNNALGLDRYNEINGRYWDENDKQLFMEDIPDAGFALDAKVDVSGAAFQTGSFAFSIGARGQGRGNLDRDYFSLALYGNPLDEVVDFSNTWGGGYAVGTATISFGHAVRQIGPGTLAAGFNLHYLQGIYEIHIDRAGGMVNTTAESIDGSAYVEALSAEGGQGYGIDLGVIWQTDKWGLAAAIDNATTRINWDRGLQEDSYEVTATGIALLNGDLGTAVVERHDSRPASPYQTHLPRTYRVGLAHDQGGLQTNFDLVYEEGFTNTQPASRKAALGAEYRLTKWLMPRAGLRYEEGTGTGGAVGIGLDTGHWIIDAAGMTSGGVLPGSAKGFGVAIGTHVMF